MTDTDMLKNRLMQWGFLFPVFNGIQIDLNVVSKLLPDGGVEDASLCDHNCTLDVGGYECPSAFTRNRRLKPRFASWESLFVWIFKARQGMSQARDTVLQFVFERYCDEFRVPTEAAKIIRENLRSELVEVNLFGGNPEMHPGVLKLIKVLRSNGFVVNLTTTGRRFIRQPSFVTEFEQNQPNLIAVSADDYEPIDGFPLESVLAMESAEIAALWKKVSPLAGQAQKFLEGIYTARLAHERGNWPTVLFNMVIHRRNLGNVRAIIDGISSSLPKALTNPYPGQSSFEDGGNIFDEADLPQFEGLVDYFIHETVNGNPNITKRLHYWLVLKSVLETYRAAPHTACAMLAGYGIWQCFRRIGTGMYVQIGKANPDFESPILQPSPEPGGHLGCYWQNRTVTEERQILGNEQVRQYLLGGMQQLHASSRHSCPGCCMPRLWFNMMNTELGLHREIVPKYLELRYSCLGF